MGVLIRLLLDTHGLLWLLDDDRRLSPEARRILSSPDMTPLVSVVSLWEIGIKAAKGRLDFERSFGDLVGVDFPENGIELLPITAKHLDVLTTLPFPASGHADPFDRMLVAQAPTEGIDLLSADAKLDAYGVRRVW